MKTEPDQTASAVALSYDRETKRAPIVVAKGRGAVAEQILELAFANDVKVREDADLVELLQAVDIDSPIPLEAFAAVAEIVAFLYRANADWGAPPPRFDAPLIDQPDYAAIDAAADDGAADEGDASP